MINCRTCGESISEHANYCPHCGAKVIIQRLSVLGLFARLVSILTNLNSPFLLTSRWLLSKPEKVTIGFIKGVRKVINGPLQYALIILSIYSIFQYIFSDFLDLATQENFLAGFQEGMTGREESSVAAEKQEYLNSLINWAQARIQFFNFFMVPIIGLMANLIYTSRGFNLAEHIVIVIYAVAFTTLVSILVGLFCAPFYSKAASDTYIMVSNLLFILLMVWILKKSLQGSWLKPLLVIFLSFILFIILFFFLMAFIAFT